MSLLTEKEALSRMASYCSKSEHCRADVYEKLWKWEFNAAAIDRMLDALEAGGYIDEERYCRSFVYDKFRLNKWGRLKISQALYQKRIPEDIVRKYLGEIDEEEYISVLQKLLDAKRKSMRGRDEEEQHVKLARFAASRGFEMKHIRQCLAGLDLFME